MATRKRKRKKTGNNKPKGRERRLSKAPEWVALHRGKPANMLKRYRKYFGVDWECSISELNELGIEFDDTYLASLRKTIASHFPNEKRHPPISRWEFDLYHGINPESDDTFAFIAGYTSGGAPYGVTYEELEKKSGTH